MLQMYDEIKMRIKTILPNFTEKEALKKNLIFSYEAGNIKLNSKDRPNTY